MLEHISSRIDPPLERVSASDHSFSVVSIARFLSRGRRVGSGSQSALVGRRGAAGGRRAAAAVRRRQEFVHVGLQVASLAATSVHFAAGKYAPCSRSASFFVPSYWLQASFRCVILFILFYIICRNVSTLKQLDESLCYMLCSVLPLGVPGHSQLSSPSVLY